MTLWYLTNDLMFSSRVVSHAERAGHTVVMVASPALMTDRLQQGASGDPPALVLIDLTLAGLNVGELVPRLRAAAPNARILAYGPHVQTALLASAQGAGCDEVMSNGQFDRSLGEILR